ncbi:hypothetical protein FJTKL_13964 [Diaporthe vaccinii]|uniref:Amidase domain-containing protein n=1 Tax=Diaporthe vaccinii TaxID=105482 RepID=A0ABR4F9L3_9PEZI
MASNIPPLPGLTLQQIAQGLDHGDFTVKELTEAHLARIKALDPSLHALLQLNPAAISIATALDEEMMCSGRRGPLHGVPTLIKDNIVTNEALEATAGSLALLGCKPIRESPAVTKLRAAGAVILGTSNCSEWANFRSRPSDSGWSARGGQTYGAYHDNQDPGGSSSGSAVGVDVGMCVLALGTETSGSIIIPAARNNIVGIKTTTGLVSRASVIPVSQEQDTVGPMARTVTDAATMLGVIAGKDGGDTKTNLIPFEFIPDYRGACEHTDISSLRVGIPRNSVDKAASDEILESFWGVVDLLRTRVAEVIEFEFPGQATFDDLSPEKTLDAMAGDFNIAIADYLGKLTNNPDNLQAIEDICELVKSTEGEEYPERNIARLEQAASRVADSAEYMAGQEVRTYLAGDGGIKGALNKHSLDAIVVPSKAPANYFAACGGFPQITIPLGYQTADLGVKFNDTGNLVEDGPNIPYGISIIGDSFSEVSLLRIGTVLENITRTRDAAGARRLQRFR